jgi:hypothetical protein
MPDIKIDEFPPITTLQNGDILYPKRGTGAGADKSVDAEAIIPQYNEKTGSATVDLATFFADTTVICNSGALMTLTLSNILPIGRRLTIINIGAGSVSVVGAAAVILFQNDEINYISTGAVLYGAKQTAPVGTSMQLNGTVIPKGWILENGNSIGDGGSGATLTGVEYRQLFDYLWNEINSGAEYTASGALGASAAADWAAALTINVPDKQGIQPQMIGTQDINANTKGRLTLLGEIAEDQAQVMTGAFGQNNFDNGSLSLKYEDGDLFRRSNETIGVSSQDVGASGTAADYSLITFDTGNDPDLRTGTYNESNVIGVNFIIKL